MPTITISSGKQFSAKPDETLLDAALHAGIVLEHSCRTGRSGTCRAHIKSGTTHVELDELGLSVTEQESGWVLTCARNAVSDVELEVEDLGSIHVYQPKTLPCRIHSIERLSSDVVKVSLRLPPNQPFSYHAGQYIDVIGHNGLRRSYSIANAAAETKLIDFHIRLVEGGAMSRYWFDQAQPNDLLRLNGPLGTFFLRDVAGKELVFLATGTGIAPVKAMLEGLSSLAHEAQPRSIHLYWGGRIPEDLYWNPLDLGLALTYTPVLSRAPLSWEGARGHVQTALLNSSVNLHDALVYACGSAVMIASARASLLMAGLDVRHFHSDAFVCSSLTTKEKL